MLYLLFLFFMRVGFNGFNGFNDTANSLLVHPSPDLWDILTYSFICQTLMRESKIDGNSPMFIPLEIKVDSLNVFNFQRIAKGYFYLWPVPNAHKY